LALLAKKPLSDDEEDHEAGASDHQAEQHEADEADTVYGLLPTPAPLPKGQSGPTMTRIPRDPPGRRRRRLGRR
jgi:hypothetical protein